MSNENVETMYLYTEKATRLIYEAQLFEDYALVRPVDPLFHDVIVKMTLADLANDYDEYAGDASVIRAFYSGTEAYLLH